MWILLSVSVFVAVADWWGKQREISEGELEEFIDRYPNLFGVGVATAVHTSMALGSGFVDLLRLGEGTAQGGWGYGRDALRLLVVAGPIFRGGRLLLARATPNATGPVCSYIASAGALRRTGTRFFVRASDLIAKSGGGAPTSMSQLLGLLRTFGAKVRSLGQPSTVADLQRLTATHRNGVVLFGIRWTRPSGAGAGHALYAFRDGLGRFRIADRTGRIVGQLSELNSSYANIGNATMQGTALLVENATIVGGTSYASMLALSMNATIVVREGEANRRLEESRRTRQRRKRR